MMTSAMTVSRALGSVTSFAVAAGIAVTLAPAAAADTYCGQSSHGASVSAGPDTTCEYALNAANTPLSKVSQVSLTDSSSGQTQTVPASNPFQDIDDLCDGKGAMVTHPSGLMGVACEDGRKYYIRD